MDVTVGAVLRRAPLQAGSAFAGPATIGGLEGFVSGWDFLGWLGLCAVNWSSPRFLGPLNWGGP